nr:hypothetical protein [Marinicella sp. W31]MDC2875915.1 hypothetical protein [Marinicella sp. W31]
MLLLLSHRHQHLAFLQKKADCRGLLFAGLLLFRGVASNAHMFAAVDTKRPLGMGPAPPSTLLLPCSGRFIIVLFVWRVAARRCLLSDTVLVYAIATASALAAAALAFTWSGFGLRQRRITAGLRRGTVIDCGHSGGGISAALPGTATMGSLAPAAFCQARPAIRQLVAVLGVFHFSNSITPRKLSPKEGRSQHGAQSFFSWRHHSSGGRQGQCLFFCLYFNAVLPKTPAGACLERKFRGLCAGLFRARRGFAGGWWPSTGKFSKASWQAGVILFISPHTNCALVAGRWGIG